MSKNRKLTSQQARLIFIDFYKNRETIKTLVNKFNVSNDVVLSVIKRRAYLNETVDMLYLINDYQKILNIPGEIWVDIKDYEGLYKISNYGRIVALARKNSNGHFLLQKMIKTRIDNSGYKMVNLSKNGEISGFLVHRLLGIHFIPNPNNLPQIHHKDFNKLNNKIDNLIWVTHKENMEYSFPTKESNIKNKIRKNYVRLTKDSVLKIRNDYLTDRSLTHSNLAKKYNVSKGAIRGVISNINWFDKEYQLIIESETYKERTKKANNITKHNKITEKEVIYIRKLYEEENYSRTQIQTLFPQFAPTTIRNILKRITWKHI